ncbi:hypothetical protein JCM8097_006629 [Rhodosporidiobolus ruineniae]
MPVPPLPLEVVSLIVEQVRMSSYDEDEDKYDDSTIVRMLELASQGQDPTGTTDSAQEAKRETAATHVASILAECPQLYSLSLSSDWLAPVNVLSVARHITSIRELKVEAEGSSRLLAPKAFLHQVQSLPFLERLELYCRVRPADLNTSNFPPPNKLLSLRNLDLFVPYGSTVIQAFATPLLRSISPTTLTHCALHLYPKYGNLLDDLVRFEHLAYLHFMIDTAAVGTLFDDILSLAPHLPTLHTLVMDVGGRGRDFRCDRFPTLASFLSSLPPIPD